MTFCFSYMSLGVRNVDDGDIDKMMAEAPGALDFTTFLNMLAEKLHGTDSEDVILEGMSYLNSFHSDTFIIIRQVTYF